MGRAYTCVREGECVCVCVCARERAWCVRACVRACVCSILFHFQGFSIGLIAPSWHTHTHTHTHKKRKEEKNRPLGGRDEGMKKEMNKMAEVCGNCPPFKINQANM